MPLVVISLLVLVTIAGMALLPSQLIADKQVPDPDHEGETIDVDTPYALVPAAAEPVADRVSYGDDLGADIAVDTDPAGRVYFVTISEPPQSLLGYFVAQDEPRWLPGPAGAEPEILFRTREDKYGSQTPSQQRTIGLQMMRSSSQVAQFVALTRAGFDAEIIPGQVQIGSLGCLEITDGRCTEFVPNAEQLDDGDTFIEADGVRIETLDDLTEALADNKPGDTIEVTVDRIDVGEVTVDVELMAAADDPERPIIGFQPFDTRSVDLPFEIQIDTGQIGGPSAGLAFTLTLIDELTEGDLLGGLDVAVTGTIELDGTVGAIGGLVQKASAVRQAGLDYFLVPASQSPDELAAAREVAGDGVELIPVATVEEALAALEELGGDALVELDNDPLPD